MRVYLDACVIIYRVEGAPASKAAIRAALEALGPEAPVSISDLVRMECLVKPRRLGDVAMRASYEEQFTLFACLPLPPAVFDLAAEIRAVHRLKTPDALHVACALHHDCDELWTNDNRLATLAGRLSTRWSGERRTLGAMNGEFGG